MTKIITTIYKTTHDYCQKTFVILLACIFVTIFAYIFLLQKAIINVVDREQVSKQAKSLSAEIGNLEAQYLSLKNTVTLELAREKGLTDASNISYISKKSLTAVAPRNEL